MAEAVAARRREMNFMMREVFSLDRERSFWLMLKEKSCWELEWVRRGLVWGGEGRVYIYWRGGISGENGPWEYLPGACGESSGDDRQAQCLHGVIE